MLKSGSRWLVLAVVTFCAPLVLGGNRPASMPAVDFSQTWLLHLPGIGGARSIDRHMTAGLKDGGWEGPISIYDWTANDPGINALLSYERNKKQAQKVEEMIADKLAKDPDLKITLTSHSGGTGIAVWALEDLPEGVQVQTLVLLASALSPDYDLSKALRHVRGKAYVFFEVHLERRANEQGHLFGSVTATDVAKGLQGQGFNVLPEDINLPGRLDRIDTYTVQVKFAEDLQTDVKVWVNADPESKAAIEAARKAAATETPENA